MVDQRNVAGSGVCSRGLPILANRGENFGSGLVARSTHSICPKRGAGKDEQNQRDESFASKIHEFRRDQFVGLRRASGFRFKVPVSNFKIHLQGTSFRFDVASPGGLSAVRHFVTSCFRAFVPSCLRAFVRASRAKNGKKKFVLNLEFGILGFSWFAGCGLPALSGQVRNSSSTR